jgi:hypothetical protein
MPIANEPCGLDCGVCQQPPVKIPTKADAKQLFRQLDTIIEDAVVIKSHLRQGDPEDVIELATNIEGLAQLIQDTVRPTLGWDFTPELFRTLFADL